MIEIVNMKVEKFVASATNIRCDRQNKILGNHAGKSFKSRSEQIEAFRAWFKIQLADKALPMNPVRVEMNRLYSIYKTHGVLRLFCWCAPLACHTEVIRDALLAAISLRPSV